MKKIIPFAFLALMLNACTTNPQFTVEGHVKDADGKTLYLEASELSGVVKLDSVVLNDNGIFKFNHEIPKSPDFYRLTVEDKTINFVVDSVETVTVESSYNNFSTQYTIEEAEVNKKIKELVVKQAQLQQNVNQLRKELNNNKIGYDLFEQSLSTLLTNYKNDVKLNYIFANPRLMSSYFALFQKIDNYLIFDPLNSREDIKCFGAVATSLQSLYPHALRTKNLYNIVIKGMQNTRQAKKAEKEVTIPSDKISETGLIDIALQDLKGDVRKLSDLKGKVVLLDFSVLQSPYGATHNLYLRDLYKKYTNQGFEIYQISLDADEHYWKTVVDKLPWVCVRDAAGVRSTNLATYNVHHLPTFFLINRKNELVGRSTDITDLENTIKKLL